MTQESNANLASIEAIRQLKARYCRLVDTKQWARLKQQLTDGARLEGFGTIEDGVSPTAFVDTLTDILASAVTIHHVHNPEIQILGEDYARGIWAMVDYVQFANVSEHAGGNLGWVGWGYYEEEYAKVSGDWRISHMRLVRVRMDVLRTDYPAVKPGRIAPTLDWL